VTSPTRDLCRVCLRQPAGADGTCDTCRPWHTDAPTWTHNQGHRDPGYKIETVRRRTVLPWSGSARAPARPLSSSTCSRLDSTSYPLPVAAQPLEDRNRSPVNGFAVHLNQQRIAELIAALANRPRQNDSRSQRELISSRRCHSLTCQGCGHAFRARSDAKFCCGVCRQRAYRQRHRRDSNESL
jgi:hypothetical protein